MKILEYNFFLYYRYALFYKSCYGLKFKTSLIKNLELDFSCTVRFEPNNVKTSLLKCSILTHKIFF